MSASVILIPSYAAISKTTNRVIPRNAPAAMEQAPLDQVPQKRIEVGLANQIPAAGAAQLVRRQPAVSNPPPQRGDGQSGRQCGIKEA